jgi:endonuclease/exonuclease/phosphatase (EEP) superfamily protein YafD
VSVDPSRDVDAGVPGGRVRRAVRVADAVLAGAVGAALLALTVPLFAGSAPVAQLVSFRAVVGLAALTGAALVLAVPWLRRRALALGLVLLVGGLAQAGVLAARGVPHQPGGSAAGGPLVVLSFNTADVVDAATLARLVETERADVAALPETSRATAERTAALLAADGLPMAVEVAPSAHPWIQGTALLVSTDSSPGTPTMLALPVGGVRVGAAGGVVVAGHTTAPVASGRMAAWRTDTATLADACTDEPGAVVAGDFNATLDHPGLRRLGPCVDAAAAAGRASLGTWPANAPTWLSAPIDHVLVDARTWRVASFAVLAPTGDSDHRPVVAHLVRR